MAECINNDNEIDIESSTPYAEDDPLYRKEEEYKPINGFSYSKGDINTTEEIKSSSEIKKCKPPTSKMFGFASKVEEKCDPKEPSLYTQALDQIINGKEKGSVNFLNTAATPAAQAIIAGVSTMFAIFFIYKNGLYNPVYLKPLFFTFIFLFKRLICFTIIITLLILVFVAIFKLIPKYSRRFFRLLAKGLKPLLDDKIKRKYEKLKKWKILPFLYLILMMTYYLLLAFFMLVFILFLLFPLIVLSGYVIGVALSFMAD